jgi:hypothetical protein
MTPEQRAFIAQKAIGWIMRDHEPSLHGLMLACSDRRTLAYQLPPVSEVKHRELMLRSGLRLGFITPLGNIKPMGNA